MTKEKSSKIKKEKEHNIKETTSKKVVNKKKAVLICSVLIVLLLCITLGFIFLKSDKKDNKNQNNQHLDSSKIVRITDTNGTEFDPYSFVYSLNLGTLPEEYFGYFFKRDSVNVNDLENKVKIFLAIRKLIAEDEEKYADEEKEIHISAELVEKALKIIFGRDVSYTHESLGGNSCTFTGFNYDADKKEYIQKPSDNCTNIQNLIVYTEQGNVTVVDNIFEIPITAVFVETVVHPESTDISYNYYQDINKQTLLTTNSQYNIGEIKDKLQSYKFQFNIVDGIHQFSVFERTK